MKIEQVKKMSPLDRLVYWIQERESIRRKKSLKVFPPYTDDEILQKYRFCNVVRMDDKVSRWLYTNWYKPEKNHTNMVVATALARHFNLPSVFINIGFPFRWNPEYIKETVRDMKSSGKRVFNAAYMVRGIGTSDKTEMVVDRVCQPLVDNPPQIDTSSMRKSVESLLPYWGFSSFMAGQVVADLRWALTGIWKDRNTWAPIGPGSLRGMNQLMGREKNKPLKQEQFLQELQQLISEGTARIEPEITKRMEAIDWQNVLCETDKYNRVLTGEGKPKQLYRGGT